MTPLGIPPEYMPNLKVCGHWNPSRSRRFRTVVVGGGVQ